MTLGDRVRHPIFGFGTIIHVAQRSEYDGRQYPNYNGGSHGQSIPSNGESRYKGTPNLGVKFDNGGPVGFAQDASNNIKDLTVVT